MAVIRNGGKVFQLSIGGGGGTVNLRGIIPRSCWTPSNGRLCLFSASVARPGNYSDWCLEAWLLLAVHPRRARSSSCRRYRSVVSLRPRRCGPSEMETSVSGESLNAGRGTLSVTRTRARGLNLPQDGNRLKGVCNRPFWTFSRRYPVYSFRICASGSVSPTCWSFSSHSCTFFLSEISVR